MSTTTPKRTLSPSNLEGILSTLRSANTAFNQRFPGESGRRQPVHTVYGGAQLFKADTAQKMGGLALRSLAEYAPNFVTFAKALGLRGSDSLPEGAEAIASLEAALKADPEGVRIANEPAWRTFVIYQRVVEKLNGQAVEDFRIDFEDGFGNRPDDEEDHHALRTAEETARGFQEGILPPFIGIRIKPFTEELRERSIRTLDLYVSALVEKLGGRLPENFVVTLPKVVIAEQVTALIDLFEVMERELGLPAGALKMEFMVETPQSILDHEGRSALPLFLAAARGRCVGAHFGTYDYTAGCNITAMYQHMRHPACDFARHAMQVTLAGTGLMLSDGATNVMPVGPHRPGVDGTPITSEQIAENRTVVHRAWKLHFDDIQHSLEHAYYQGWDLHPAQLPTRYAAVYAFFMDGLAPASARLKNFIEKAAQATLVGDVFDDAATGQGLLNFFLRGINCGALTEEEALVTGVTLDELRGRSFVKILANRRQ